MKIGISEITTLKVSLQQDLEAFSVAGWSNVELSIEKVNEYLKSHTVSDLRGLLDRLHLEPAAAIGLAPSGPGLLTARGAAFDAYLEQLDTQLQLCQQLGVPVLGVGSDPAREVAEGEDWRTGAVENAKIATARAERRGIALAFEALSLAPPIGPFLMENLVDTHAFVTDVDHELFGLSFDIFHFCRSGGKAVDVDMLNSGQILNVHVADLPDMPRDSWEDSHRLFPGDGVLPLTEIRDRVVALGYDGHWTLELLNEHYWAEDPLDIAQRGLTAMKRFF